MSRAAPANASSRAQEVYQSFVDAAQSGRLDQAGIDRILVDLKSVNPEEQEGVMLASQDARVQRAMEQAGTWDNFFGDIQEMPGLRQYTERAQAQVEQVRPGLVRALTEQLTARNDPPTLSGRFTVPEAVRKEILSQLFDSNGEPRKLEDGRQLVYDVRELNGFYFCADAATVGEGDEAHSFIPRGVNSPYPQSLEPAGEMQWWRTELNPDRIQELKTQGLEAPRAQRFVRIGDQEGDHYEVVTEPAPNPKWTSLVIDQTYYAHATNVPYCMVGPNGEPFSNNCMVLANGEVHFCPYDRMEPGNPFLTNPSLARGELAIFNGHVNAQPNRNGELEITYIGWSGRLKGHIDEVDMAAIFKAAGFKVSPYCQVVQE